MRGCRKPFASGARTQVARTGNVIRGARDHNGSGARGYATGFGNTRDDDNETRAQTQRVNRTHTQSHTETRTLGRTEIGFTTAAAAAR